MRRRQALDPAAEAGQSRRGKLRATAAGLWGWFSRTLNSRTTWLALSNFSGSFLSRALAALSLSSLVLANMPDFIEASGIPMVSLNRMLVGSAFFLLGYLIFSMSRPPAFAQAGQQHEHVQRMLAIADVEYIKSKLDTAQRLSERIKKQRLLPPPVPVIDWLDRACGRVEAMVSKPDFKVGDAVGLLDVELEVRQYDRPARRLLVALLMLIGVSLLLYPTVGNVVAVIVPDWPSEVSQVSVPAAQPST